MLKTKVIFVIMLNSIIVGVEILFGLLANSMALITDAMHNFGDILSIIIALFAIIFSERRATRNMTYGYIRSEMMAGFINSLFLILTMGYILYESIIKLMKPASVNGITMIIVAGIALIANTLSAFLLKDHNLHTHAECKEDSDSQDKEKNEHTAHEDLNIKAAYIHLLSDIGISLCVVVGGIVIFLFKITIIDSIFSIIFSIYIVFEAIKIFKKTFFSLMDASVDNLGQIENQILSHKEIISIHDIHISKPASKDTYFSAHIIIKEGNNLEKIEELFEILRCELKDYGVTHALFQPETDKYHNLDSLCQSHYD